jgi:hypothetical protein
VNVSVIPFTLYAITSIFTYHICEWNVSNNMVHSATTFTILFAWSRMDLHYTVS